MKGQRRAVLEHLQKEGHLTSMEAFEKFGATRLSAIIFDLRKLGYNIETKMLLGKTRYGDTKQYGEYIYLGKEND